MKNFSLITLIAFLLFGQSAIAQDFYILPNPVFLNGVTADDVEEVGYADIYNASDTDLSLTWERTVIDMTEGWQSAVCDVVQCYFPHVSTMDFDLLVDSIGDMDVHVYPNGIEGHAIIEVKVFETGNPSNSTIAVYYFNQTVGVAERFTEAIKIYPNPTQDYISIDNAGNLAAKAEIYSVSGKLVLSRNLMGSERINVQNLPSGNYIVKLLDENSKIVSTNLLVKQ